MDNEHERIYDKISELHVDVAIVQTQMAGVVKSVDQLCGKVDGIQSNDASESKSVTTKLLDIMKILVIAVTAGGLAGGTIQAMAHGTDSTKAPQASEQQLDPK